MAQVTRRQQVALERIERALSNRRRALADLRVAIDDARAAGLSNRRIGDACGLSAAQVYALLSRDRRGMRPTETAPRPDGER